MHKESLKAEKAEHKSLDKHMSHKEHLAAEHGKHEQRLEHEKAMHDMHGRKYHK